MRCSRRRKDGYDGGLFNCDVIGFGSFDVYEGFTDVWLGCWGFGRVCEEIEILN